MQTLLDSTRHVRTYLPLVLRWANYCITYPFICQVGEDIDVGKAAEAAKVVAVNLIATIKGENRS